eukprot:TRINITY_DN23835_c0_g1_i4.p1 TRINITY_DN23835_c0_g1~~TRINITY_DN23835_c0_g1_i4.p1  ORF type:complete len:419 (-),score=86.89 TRINITY_DN23835_c0_g1_i4:325-1581(-)
MVSGRAGHLAVWLAMCCSSVLRAEEEMTGEKAQRIIYNASRWWTAPLLADPYYGKVLVGLADLLTELVYDFYTFVLPVCQEPVLGCDATMCNSEVMAERTYAIQASVLQRMDEVLQELQSIGPLDDIESNMPESADRESDDWLFSQLVAKVAATRNKVALLPTVRGCSEAGDIVERGRHGLCVPVADGVNCLTGISQFANVAMASVHAAQIAAVAERHADVSVATPVHAHFEDSIGHWRAEILRSLLLRGRRADDDAAVDGPVAAEIGVHDGRTSVQLLDALPQLRLLLVDPFEYADKSYFDEEVDYRKLAEGGAERLWRRLEPFRHRSVFYNQKSLAAADLVADGRLDLVFIDGDHSYESVRADLRAWRRKLREGGTLAGHDYSLLWPGVVKAVHEFARELGVVLFTGPADMYWMHF